MPNSWIPAAFRDREFTEELLVEMLPHLMAEQRQQIFEKFEKLDEHTARMMRDDVNLDNPLRLQDIDQPQRCKEDYTHAVCGAGRGSHHLGGGVNEKL